MEADSDLDSMAELMSLLGAANPCMLICCGVDDYLIQVREG